MAKKQKTEQQKMEEEALSKLPKEAQEKLKDIKKKLERFQKEVISKFDKYISGIALLPPPKEGEVKPEEKDNINILVLVDDTDSQRMSKQELKDKLEEDRIRDNYKREKFLQKLRYEVEFEIDKDQLFNEVYDEYFQGKDEGELTEPEKQKLERLKDYYERLGDKN